jgi:small conductance mechanosensitive channel
MGFIIAQANTSTLKTWNDRATEYGIPALKVVLFMVVAWLIARWVSMLIERSMAQARVERSLSRVFSRVARYAILLIAGFVALGIFGINTASFVAVLGSVGLAAGIAAGLAAGFALQNTLANIAAGLALQITRPYEIGDVVHIGTQTGTVDALTLFATRLRADDSRQIMIANAQVLAGPVENLSHEQASTVAISLSAAGGSGIDMVRDTLLQAASGVRGRVEGALPSAVLQGVDDGRQQWHVSVRVKSGETVRARERLLQACKEALDRGRLG